MYKSAEAWSCELLLLFEEAFVIIVKTIERSLWKGDCMMLWKVEQRFEEKTSISEVECVVCGVPLCKRSVRECVHILREEHESWLLVKRASIMENCV
jgi:hypothetical protein